MEPGRERVCVSWCRRTRSNPKKVSLEEQTPKSAAMTLTKDGQERLLDQVPVSILESGRRRNPTVEGRTGQLSGLGVLRILKMFHASPVLPRNTSNRHARVQRPVGIPGRWGFDERRRGWGSGCDSVLDSDSEVRSRVRKDNSASPSKRLCQFPEGER